MKKTLERLLIVLLTLGIGFGIYFVILKPPAASVAGGDYRKESNIVTEEFFNTNLQNATGPVESLDQYHGKTLIVNFWATWCPPCREEMPDLSALYDAYRDQNLVVLGLAIDALAAVKDFQAQSPVSYPLYIAEDEGMVLSSQLGNQKGVLPFTAIINAKGRVTHTFYGKVDQKMLKKALQNTP